MKTLTEQEKFFHENAGYSWNPETETREQGKIRCAKELAKAETEAAQTGIDFAWQVDPDCTSSEFSDEEPAWELWICQAIGESGDVLASLGGIDFGPDEGPIRNPYARVVRAELAMEALRKIDKRKIA